MNELKVYEEELFRLGHGTPLYDPDPRGYGYERVEVADVGWLKDGAFHKFLNLFAPRTDVEMIGTLGSKQRGKYKPSRLSPGMLKSSSMHMIEGDIKMSTPSP